MNTLIRKKLAAFVTVSLTAAMIAVVPSVAQAADPQCAVASGITQCAGATSDGALYTMMAPLNFNGTMLLWSHGLRPNIDIPVGIPGYGGYTVNGAAEWAPGLSDKDTTVMFSLLSQGYGLAGSGFSRQGVNVSQAVAANVELIGAFKKQFTKTTKVVAWGASLGTLITQKLAETHPGLVNSTALLCPATAPPTALTSYFGDFMWGFKTFFDPTIKGFGYSAGAAGVAEAKLDLFKFFTALGALQAGLLSGAWPATSSPAGKALEANLIPSRSALTLIALMAGVPLRSENVDGVSGPLGQELRYALGVAPAVAALQNAGTVGLAEILLMQDGENQTGGIVFDNTKTDYAARVDAERDIYTVAMSSGDAIDAMLNILAATPRVTASPAALAKMNTLIEIKGKVSHPTVMLTTESDQFTVAGAGQWMIDQYAQQSADEKAAAITAAKKSRLYVAPQNMLAAIWDKTADKYSKFTAAGSPDLTATIGDGTGHCKYSAKQILAVAKMAIGAAETNRLPNPALIATAARKVGLSYDKKFSVPTFKSLG